MKEEKPLIHWASTPKGVCARKDAKTDVRSEVQGQTTITHSAEANHTGNVTCPVCRKYIRDQL